MNVSELSDEELNRAIIEHRFGSGDKDIENMYKAGKLNYLTDWSLTGKLAFDNYISTVNIGGSTQWFACNDVSFETVCMSPDGSDNGVSCFNARHEAYSTNPLRAICECYLMINHVQGK